MVIEVNAEMMLRLGLNQLGYSEFQRDRVCNETNRSRFEAAFGVSPLVCSMVFRDIQLHIADAATIDNPKPLLLLMSFHWLRTYPIETMTAANFKFDEDTVRKWVWKYCKAIQALRHHKIKWYENLQNNDIRTTWLLSVDGTHCRIMENRIKPDKDLYSHKHHKPCLSYEIGIDLFESKIVWVSGPHKGGESDLQIFRKRGGLQDKIPDNKQAIGDFGYRNATKVAIPNEYDTKEVNIFKRRARARHENLNSYLKNFEVLNQRFRHPTGKHEIAFEAVCVLVQYSLENGHPLYQV